MDKNLTIVTILWSFTNTIKTDVCMGDLYFVTNGMKLTILLK